MYSPVITGNNAIPNSRNSPKAWISGAFITKEITMGEDDMLIILTVVIIS